MNGVLKYRFNSNGSHTYSGNDIFILCNRPNSFESTVKHSKVKQEGLKKGTVIIILWNYTNR